MRDSECSANESEQLKDLDNLLKCAICYEYLKITLMTPCSHNFCSYCIRKSLSYRNQCPTCFEDVTDSQLRSNRVVDEFISIFTSLKGKLVQFFSNLPKESRVNSKIEEVPLERRNVSEVNAKETVKSSSLTSYGLEVNHGVLPSNSVPSTSKEDIHIPNTCSVKREVQIPSMFSPKKSKTSTSNETRVPCPVCSVDIPEKSINIHLDACLKRSEEKRVASGEKRKLLPKLVYHLLPDKDLRKKLQELGLSTIGDRATLINRHKRYTLLYNSECDSLKPRPVSEIIKQMKKEEEEEKKSVPQVVKKLNVDRKADPQANEEARHQYLEEHKSSFQKLIEEARRNKEARKNCAKILVPEEITIEETSNSSNSSNSSRNNTSKCLPQKLNFMSSNKDGENNHDEINVVSDCFPFKKQQENTPSKKLEKYENKTWGSDINASSSNSDSCSSNIHDVLIDDAVEEYINQGMIKNERRLSSPEQVSNSLTSVMSPVLGTKCKSKLNRTPARTPLGSCKKDLTPDLRPMTKNVSASPSESAAGQDVSEDADSDSSSNHSASIMVYTGPDCDSNFEPRTPTKISSPNSNQNTSPTTPHNTLDKSVFDLGIEEILQNSEDFISVPVSRQSARIRRAKRNSPASEANARVLRKRVKIDDL